MDGILRLPECRRRDCTHQCGPVRRVINLCDVAIRIEGWFEQVNSWAPLVPHVGPASEHVPYAGCLWLQKSTVLRAVNAQDGAPLSIFGAVASGITVVQPERP